MNSNLLATSFAWNNISLSVTATNKKHSSVPRLHANQSNGETKHLELTNCQIIFHPRELSKALGTLEVEEGKFLFVQFDNCYLLFCERDNHEFYKGIF